MCRSVSCVLGQNGGLNLSFYLESIGSIDTQIPQGSPGSPRAHSGPTQNHPFNIKSQCSVILISLQTQTQIHEKVSQNKHTARSSSSLFPRFCCTSQPRDLRCQIGQDPHFGSRAGWILQSHPLLLQPFRFVAPFVACRNLWRY